MARRKILADMGYEFTVMGADIDEKRIRKDNAEELVVALAEAKMLSCQGSKQLIIWRKIPIPLC
uniref:Maf protein n=2 Tax=Solanum TaxID=4107 RepID=M0ZVF4_SOLTU